MIANTPTHELRLPPLYNKQRAAIFHPARYVVIEASTKSGKTAGCLVWILAEAWQHGREGRNWWWVAPVYGQAKIAYSRMSRMLSRAGRKIGVKAVRKNDTEMWIELPNGARITFKSAEKPDNLYGEDVYGAVFDEASRARPEAWHALRSTLTATKGNIRIIGNVKGRLNWAHVLGQRAKSGDDPTMHYAKLTAYDAVDGGVLDAEEVEDAKRKLPENVFRELYLAEPSDDGGNPFGIAAIEACIQRDEVNGEPMVYGVDLAKSYDWTVAIGLNEGGDVCRFERWQAPWNDTLGRIPGIIGVCPAEIDSTGVGDPIVEMLQREAPCVESFKFTAQSKQRIMEGLAVAIQQGDVSFPEGPIVDELMLFEYEYTRTGVRYSAPEGMHDDCVCALALAVESMRKHPSGEIGFTLIEGARQTNRMDEFSEDDRIWRSFDA